MPCCYYYVPVKKSSASYILPANLMSFHQLLVYNFSLYLWDEFYEVIKISRIIFWLYFTFIGPCFLRAWDINADSQVAGSGGCYVGDQLACYVWERQKAMKCAIIFSFWINLKWRCMREIESCKRNRGIDLFWRFTSSFGQQALAMPLNTGSLLNASLLSFQALSQVFFYRLN